MKVKEVGADEPADEAKALSNAMIFCNAPFTKGVTNPGLSQSRFHGTGNRQSRFRFRY